MPAVKTLVPCQDARSWEERFPPVTETPEKIQRLFRGVANYLAEETKTPINGAIDGHIIYAILYWASGMPHRAVALGLERRADFSDMHQRGIAIGTLVYLRHAGYESPEALMPPWMLVALN